jgi:hypothetical protein
MTAPRQPSDRDDERPVLPDITDDERPIGWGDELSDDGSDRDNGGRRDEQWYRRERPPHHE